MIDFVTVRYPHDFCRWLLTLERSDLLFLHSSVHRIRCLTFRFITADWKIRCAWYGDDVEYGHVGCVQALFAFKDGVVNERRCFLLSDAARGACRKRLAYLVFRYDSPELRRDETTKRRETGSSLGVGPEGGAPAVLASSAATPASSRPRLRCNTETSFNSLVICDLSVGSSCMREICADR